MLSIIAKLGLESVNIPAQIVMLCAFIVMTCSFWCKDRKKILGLQVLSNLLFVVQYILLGAKTGAILSAISIGRAFLFKYKDSKKRQLPKGTFRKVLLHIRVNAILYIFIIAFLVASLVMWEGPKGIFALIATLVFTVALWADKPQNIRIGSNIASFFWISYNMVVGGYIGCVTETIMFISNTIAIIKHHNKNKCANKKDKKVKSNDARQEEKKKYEGISKKEIQAIKRKKQTI